MRSRLLDVAASLRPSQRGRYLLEVLEAAEATASELSPPELLEGIGRTARLEAVLRTLYAAAVAPPPPPSSAPLPRRERLRA